jgi:imidazolonepropionase-like amidohydrolase/Tol biopolymer transport system component
MRLITSTILALALLNAAELHAQADTSRKKPDLSLVSDRSIDIDTDEGTWISLDVSPDGQTIVFDLLGDLYTIPIAGGSATQITNSMAYDAQPRFSPDGKSVVFTSDRDGGENVWTLDLASRKYKEITKGKTTGRYRSPEWTPDGQYIVVSRSGPSIGMSKLWMYHKDGGGGYQLIRDPQPLNGAQPLTTLGAAFGKDARYIWYAQRAGAWEYNAALPQFAIYTLDRRNGRRELRANVYGSAFRPALSSDGKYLVYGTRYENQTGLRIRDLETMEERWLAYPVQRDEQESVASMDVYPGYSFTPDNKAIVVSYGGRIWRVPVDGSAPANIPFHVNTKLALGPLVRFTYPMSDSAEFVVKQIRDAVPSPDEKKLAFVSMDHLYVMDYPGGTPRRVSDLEGNETEPAWSPDGQWLAYVLWTRDGGSLYKVRVAPQMSRPVLLTTAKAYYEDPVWAPNGSRVVVARRPQQSVRDFGGFQGGTEIVWVPAAGGAPTVIAAALGRGIPHFVSTDTGRVYLFNPNEGVVSVRWDGTDPLTHLRVTGLRTPDAEQPSPSLWGKMAPAGDRALVQVSNDLYVITVPQIGTTPTVNMSNPENAEVPTRRITDVGGQFPAWSADGRHVHYSIGHSHFVYDIDRAQQYDDSVTAAKADSTARRDTTAKQDSVGRKPAGPAANPKGYQATETQIVLRAKRDIPSGTAVLRGARVVTMRGAGATPGQAEVIERGDIVVRNNRIVAVGATGSVQVPADARVIDVSGKTIVPGFVDTHAHPDVLRDQHQQPAAYLANLAYGVTTFRDPQTGTTDVLSYEDEVMAGKYVGPRVYSTGPGLFGPTYFAILGDDIKDLDHARRIMRRYSQYYDTHTLKMYITGNRQQRQWIIQAAKEQKIMPTFEGALDQRYDMTLAIDGYPGQEHALPITPLYKDVVSLMAGNGTTYTPTLIVAYGGPWAENYWYEHMPVYDDPKLQRFTPYEELAEKSRRRMRGQRGSGNAGGWFMDEEYNFPLIARSANEIIKAGGRIGIGSHGQLNGLGYHWELWSFGMGGMQPVDILRAATILGAEGLGLQTDVGSIEVGKMADLVVMDANPLENIRNSNTIRYVMKNGRLYDGNTLDEIYPTPRKMEAVPGRPERPNVRAGVQ